MDWLALYSLVVVATCWTVLIGVAWPRATTGGEGRPVAKNRGKPAEPQIIARKKP